LESLRNSLKEVKNRIDVIQEEEIEPLRETIKEFEYVQGAVNNVEKSFEALFVEEEETPSEEDEENDRVPEVKGREGK